MFKFKYLVISLLSLILVSSNLVAFTVTPIVVNHKAEPGEEITGFLIVKNPEDKLEQLEVYTGDWHRDINGQTRFVKPNIVKRSCIDWITFSPKKFTISSKDDWRIVKYKITVPKLLKGKKPAGLYYGVIFIENNPTAAKDITGQPGIGLIAKLRYAIKLEVTIPHNLIDRGKVTELEIEGENGNFKLNTYFDNLGNTKLKPTGYLDLRNDEGMTVYSTEIDKFKILPGDQRKIETECKIDLKTGQYTALIVIDYGGDRLVAGELVFNIDNQGNFKPPVWQ